MDTLGLHLPCYTHFTMDKSISGLVAEYIVAIDVTRARFPADACAPDPWCGGTASGCGWRGVPAWPRGNDLAQGWPLLAGPSSHCSSGLRQPPFPSPPPCSIPVAQGLVCAAAAKADRVEMAGVRRLFTWGTPGLVGGCIVAACAARTCFPAGAHAAISRCGRTADLCRSHAGRYFG